MQGDNPTIIRLPRKKSQITSFIEDSFQAAFNSLFHNKYELMSCSQDYNTFDFWMVEPSKQEIAPRIIELKAHLNKNFEDREMMGCDLIKLQKLRSLSIDGIKSYIFHVFEDATLVQDVNTPVRSYRRTIWSNKEILLALVPRQTAVQKISIGLKDLREQQKI